MKLIRRLLGKEKKLGISTQQIKAKIYECLGEGQPPEQVMEDNRLTGWDLLKSKSDALSYIKYTHRRMERQRAYGVIKISGRNHL